MKKMVARLLFAMLCLPCVPLIALAAEESVPGADIVAVILSYLPDSWGGWATLAISVCAALAAFVPRPSDDANVALRILYAVINAIGFNVSRAANAETKPLRAEK